MTMLLQNFCHSSSCLKQMIRMKISTPQIRIAALSTTIPSLFCNVQINGHSSSTTSLIYEYQIKNVEVRRQIHNSAIRQKAAINDVKLTLETASSSATPTNHTNDSTTSSSGSSCSQGIPLDTDDYDEEEEQEEMFVTADPILGHGTIKEWGGPRRGGSLAEPTRFGDWERKGRCTDF
ncbi:hypothetical protein ACHAWT_004171 [Skeletonema menzelii]